LIDNYETVLADLQGALADYKTGAWLEVGLDVGGVVGIFFDWVSMEQKPSVVIPKLHDASISTAVEIISGVVNGLGLTNQVTALPQCESAVENFTALIQAVEPLLKNGSETALFQAMTLIGNSFGQLLTMRTACDETFAQVKSFLAVAAQEVANHKADATAIVDMIEHYQTTAVDVQTIITLYNEDQWTNFGNAIGQFVTYVLKNVRRNEPTFLKA